MQRFITKLTLLAVALFVSNHVHSDAAEPEQSNEKEKIVTDIRHQRELFVDNHLVDSMKNVELKLHSPRREKTVFRFHSPWDGLGSAYVTYFRDGDLVRMYYRGAPGDGKPEVTCYAESKDGIHFTRPNLGLFEWEGSKENNIIWHKGFGSHNFTPFKDTRPNVPEQEKYKAFGRAVRGTKGLLAFSSADAIHWRLMADKPVLTDGAFDSQNLAFWDASKELYVAYFRIFTKGVRAIALSTSKDFLHWTKTVPIVVDGPPEHFYTNATVKYFRSPGYYFTFPKRFAKSRKKLPEHNATGISESVFMSSRDGLHFDRTFMEAMIRPGIDQRNWGDRSNMPAWGLIQTSPTEMSMYYSQHYRFDSAHMKRASFRLDGIASAHAGFQKGELTTKPITFAGKHLDLNYSTSAVGSVRIEIQDSNGKPLPGFTLKEAPELYGDKISETYHWKSGNDLSSLAGKSVRLKFVLKDCDLYSYRFID